MGLSGRKAIKEKLSKIINDNQIDFTIINGENAADDGRGITKSIADDLERVLKPLGCGVVIEAKHGCMQCRGVKKQNSVMSTSSMRGVFFENSEARMELLQLINNPRNK